MILSGAHKVVLISFKIRKKKKKNIIYTGLYSSTYQPNSKLQFFIFLWKKGSTKAEALRVKAACLPPSDYLVKDPSLSYEGKNA